MESRADVSGESCRERLVATTATTTIVSAECVTVSSLKTTVATLANTAADPSESPKRQHQLQNQPATPSPAPLTLAGSTTAGQQPPVNSSSSNLAGDSGGLAKNKAAIQQQPQQPPPDCPASAPASPKVINELSPKLGTNQNSSVGKATRNNASSSSSANQEGLKQRKSAEGGSSGSSTGSNPIHHIAASGSSPARHGTTQGGSAGVGGGTTTETGRRTSSNVAHTTTNAAATNNTTTTTTSTPRNSTKPCCFCWCCCYRCTWPSVEEIRCWGDSFDRLMKSSMGRVVFREFLKCEYSEENILFWLACEDLKKDNNPEVVEEKARLIYEDYISILSPKEVSLDSRVREIVNRNMVDPTPHTFDEAQLQIYTLMHRDSYPRFVNSTYYKKLAQLSSTSRKESSA
nr:EOG090X0IBZ [Daphnia pulex]